ncbi:MAG: Ulp1 family isopeptidase [Gammaproteobacteria bacterium]|nr:Ulp1 family isopeptidase [Gammaproteobacteria bacterium]
MEDISSKRSLPNSFRNFSTVVQEILGVIEENSNDVKKFGDVYIEPREVCYTISDENNFYTADFINLLVHYRIKQQELPICAYPIVRIEEVEGYFQQIVLQREEYAFIPINVAYDENNPAHKNHWVALIIDKKHKLIFYLDPAQKTSIPECVEVLREKQLYYHHAIISNPVNLQQKEKEEGWIRHCGLYAIEMFKIFEDYIRANRCISGGAMSNISINEDSVSLEVALSKIPCGEVEVCSQIRKNHIVEVAKILGIDLSVDEGAVIEAQDDSSESSSLKNNFNYSSAQVQNNLVPSLAISDELQDVSRMSVVNKSFSFNTTRWVVSKLNWIGGTTGTFGGHMVIVVEGLIRDPINFHALKLFVGQYEISALPFDESNALFNYIPDELKNRKGIIDNIKVFEGNEYTVNEKINTIQRYSSCSSKSAYRTPAQVRRMIDSIKIDQQVTQEARAKNPWVYEDFIPYQSAGSHRFNAKDEGENCVTWVESKLALAGLTDGDKKLDSIKALPEKHVSSCLTM